MPRKSFGLSVQNNKRNLILLSVGAFIILACAIGGIVFAVSAGSKPVEPEGLDTSSAPSSPHHGQAGTQTFLTQDFRNDHQPTVESSSSSSTSSESSSSSSSSSASIEIKPQPAPAKRPVKVEKKPANLRNLRETKLNGQVKMKNDTSQTRTIIIALVLSVLILLTVMIGGALVYVFRARWASQSIPDPEPVLVEPLHSQEIEEEIKEDQEEQRELSTAMKWVVFLVSLPIGPLVSFAVIIVVLVLIFRVVEKETLHGNAGKKITAGVSLICWLVMSYLLHTPINNFLTRLFLACCC